MLKQYFINHVIYEKYLVIFDINLDRLTCRMLNAMTI